MKLGELITQYRESHDLSQRQFASACSLSNGYISMLEKGMNPATKKPLTPTIPLLKKLAKGMGITVMELFEKVDDMPIDLSAEDDLPGAFTDDPLAPVSERLLRLRDVFFKLTPEQQEAVIAYAQGILDGPRLTLRMAGRDGSHEERRLSEEEAADLKARWDAAPKVPEDL
ncbi:MAG: helix-turn-helix transcriptional regulator [Oscillospiraceae bacterium]|nr:helix-turn-helix transcriptional regulator [Oscillospiraceae bacterium]